jgi:hypothetical protein
MVTFIEQWSCEQHIITYNNMDSSDYKNSYVPLCIFVPDKELDCLTSSYVKLNTLDNTQECLSNRHHKKAFDYDEDTLLNITAVKLRLMHLDLIITIQVKRYSKIGTMQSQSLF